MTLITDDNELLADTLIARLNKLLENNDVREDISRLVERRVVCSETILNHPTIQAARVQAARGDAYGMLKLPVFGFLGLLNGLVGVDPSLTGEKAGHGYITAVYNDDGNLITHFERTKNKEA